MLITPQLLRAWALPQPERAGDKDARGRVLVVGGAVAMPGALILAATAALRAGAGKLQLATCRSIASLVGAAIPEALVWPLPETRKGALAPAAAGKIIEQAESADAVLIGPGLMDDDAVRSLLRRVLPALRGKQVLVDAAAITCCAGHQDILAAAGPLLLSPHVGEMASLLGRDKAAVEADPAAAAVAAARALGATVALKGAETYITGPAGPVYCNRAGNVGLASSGSGDSLAGVIAGLLARGAEPLQAAVWGVYVHARAGDVLARRIGPLGYLARELLAEVPPLLAQLSGTRPRRRG